ncbi:MAG: helix-turn-helix domain-containing protein [Fastidiosipilaceae bacterium]|jgi:transcriptional regulator with XRE-family HTH domain|nr:helix-turn-helix transcriptional regulator [Clostridiaceae bacterium]
MDLKEIREEIGMSRYRLAKISGISPTSIKNIENRLNSPTLNTIIKLSDAMEMKPEELVAKLTEDLDF